MNVTIYTPEGADEVTVNDFGTGDYGVMNDQACGILLTNTEVAIFVYESGRTFYYRRWGIDYDQIVDLFEYIPDDFRQRFDLLIEQHHLNIITAIHDDTARITDYLYDIALTDTTVLAAGARLYEGMATRGE